MSSRGRQLDARAARAHLAEERDRQIVPTALPGAEYLAGELIDGVPGGAQDRRVRLLRDRIEQAAARAALSEGLAGGLSLFCSPIDHLHLPGRESCRSGTRMESQRRMLE